MFGGCLVVYGDCLFWGALGGAGGGGGWGKGTGGRGSRGRAAVEFQGFRIDDQNAKLEMAVARALADE